MPAVQPAPIGIVRHHVWGSVELSSGDPSKGSESSGPSSGTPRYETTSIQPRKGGATPGTESVSQRTVARVKGRSFSMKMKGRHKAVVEEMNAVCFHSSSDSASSRGASAPPRTKDRDQASIVNSSHVASIGSLLHQAGTFQPWSDVNTNVGSFHGERSDFCHDSHSRSNRPRPCKEKRDRYTKLIAALEGQCVDNPDEGHHEAAKELTARSPCLKGKIRDKLHQVKEGVFDEQPSGSAKHQLLSLQQLLQCFPSNQRRQQQEQQPYQQQQAPSYPLAPTMASRSGQGAMSVSFSGYHYNLPAGKKDGLLSL